MQAPLSPLSAPVLRDLIRERLLLHPEAGIAGGDHVVAGVPAESPPLRSAAVLVPLVEHPEGFTVLLTRRTDHLQHHAGQVSFPGGGVEPMDSGPVDTALREAEEEIGLPRSRVEVVGYLDPYQTVTGFLVTPVVGFVTPPVPLRPDPEEVAEVFELPLAVVLDERNHQRHSREFRGQRRHFYVLPYRDYYIWGATAAMLVGFARRLADPTASASS